MLVIVCWSLAIIAAVIVGFALAADIKAERAAANPACGSARSAAVRDVL